MPEATPPPWNNTDTILLVSIVSCTLGISFALGTTTGIVASVLAFIVLCFGVFLFLYPKVKAWLAARHERQHQHQRGDVEQADVGRVDGEVRGMGSINDVELAELPRARLRPESVESLEVGHERPPPYYSPV